jgi:hypothetical protein
MRVKVFTVTYPNEMEKVVNSWLEQNPSVEIQHVSQCESMIKESWSLTLTIFYSGESKRGTIGFESVEKEVSDAVVSV